jgi:hypothetical protein
MTGKYHTVLAFLLSTLAVGSLRSENRGSACSYFR